MKIMIETGSLADVDELEQLYNDLNDFLASGVNYPGWRKGIYPVRQDALDGINGSNLYVARENGKIVASVILNHEPEAAYDNAPWNIDVSYGKIFVVHTLAVHPLFLSSGIGTKMIDFSCERGKQTGMKAIRLDVYEKNAPAIHLYEKSGFQFVATADLGLGAHGLNWFRLYEKLL